MEPLVECNIAHAVACTLTPSLYDTDRSEMADREVVWSCEHPNLDMAGLPGV